MSEFFSERTIKATRKQHRCFGCNRLIEVGLPARYFAMKDDGNFFDAHYHVECREAEIAYNELRDTWGDEYTSICLIREDDDASEWLAWLKDEWPIVAERMEVA